MKFKSQLHAYYFPEVGFILTEDIGSTGSDSRLVMIRIRLGYSANIFKSNWPNSDSDSNGWLIIYIRFSIVFCFWNVISTLDDYNFEK